MGKHQKSVTVLKKNQGGPDVRTAPANSTVRGEIKTNQRKKNLDESENGLFGVKCFSSFDQSVHP